MDMVAGKVKMTQQSVNSAMNPTDLLERPIRLTAKDVTVHYGQKQALHGISIQIPDRAVTSFIGPSGCGKSTFLRCINRMNDTIEGAKVGGTIKLDDQDIYDPSLDVVELRARIGMVFQKPNPFPKSIYENVAYGPKIHGLARNKTDLDEIVVSSLRKAGLFEEVKDRLNEPGTGLSGGQQQRLCIARAIAVGPEVILMDEPCSALDPIATAIIEELIDELRENYTIVIVTHSMQQAARVSQKTAFFHLGGRNRVQRRAGLVHQQHFRRGRHSAGNAQTLLLPPRKPGARSVQTVLHLVPQSGLAQARFHDPVQLRLVAGQAMDAGPVSHIVIDRLRERVRLLEHHAHFRAQLHRVDPLVVDILTIEQDIALHLTDRDGVVHPVQRAQEGRFPATRRPDESGDRLVKDVDRDILDGMAVAIIDLHRAGFDPDAVGVNGAISNSHIVHVHNSLCLFAAYQRRSNLRRRMMAVTFMMRRKTSRTMMAPFDRSIKAGSEREAQE